MNDRRVGFAGVSIELPEGWFDVTSDTGEDAPFTLARSDGVGALQFSPAFYKSGALPRIATKALLELLDDFAERQDLEAPTNVQQWTGETSVVSGDFIGGGEFIRAWYISNGSDIILATYVALDANQPDLVSELSAADAIVRSIVFPPTHDPRH